MPDTAAHQVQVRPNRYLVARSTIDPGRPPRASLPTDDGWVTLQAPAPGTYSLAGDFSLTTVFGGDGESCG